MGWAEDQKVYDEMLADWRKRRAALDAEWDVLRPQGEEILDRRLAEVTDEQILADTDLRLWLCKVHGNHTGAYRRARDLMSSELLTVNSIDGRDEYYAQSLPIPTLILERDSDTAAVAAEVERWFGVWGLGRTTLPLGILESTLSEHGSYSVLYDPEGKTVLSVMRWGSYSEVFSGTLAEVVAYVAQHHPYNEGRRMDDDDDDY